MIDFRKHGIQYNPTTDYNVITNDLIAIGNISRNIVDTYVVEDRDTTMVIEGEYTISDTYAIAGGEIIKVNSSSHEDNLTTLNVTRGLKGTLQENWVGFKFRTVELFDELNTEADVIEWSFEDTLGSINNNLFPVELGSGSIYIKSDLSLWSPTSLNRKFRIRNRKTVVYIFKGLSGKRFLKSTAIVTKLGVNTRSKKESNKIKLDIKTKLASWYDKDLSINRQLKGTTPKEFFKMLFSLKDDEVYYANGVDETCFLKINNLHTKEYKKVSEILKAYCSNGIRFCFDQYERVKIFSDFKVGSIQPQKVVYEDLTESTLTEDETMIYNTISTKSVQRQTMYNFEDMQNKYVLFSKVLRNAVSSDKFLKLENNGDIAVNTITITNSELHSSCQIGDLVCFKRTVEPYYEYYASVLDVGSENKVTITPILYDKDFKLFPYGKNRYLYNILNSQVCQLDLYYVRQELPMIFKYTRNKGGNEKDASLEYPILPRVNGETLYPVETNIEFGCASSLKVGKYTGIVEEVDKIYGTWDSSKLLYNREIDQFSNTIYPPIFALTNKMSERVIDSKIYLKNYTHFDNSDFLLEIKEPKDNKGDATLIMYNTSTVNKDIDLFVDTELNRLGNKVIVVSDLSAYKIGDVLVANKPDDLTPQEETEFEEVISNLRWVVIGKDLLSATKNGGKSLKLHKMFNTTFHKNDEDEIKKNIVYDNYDIIDIITGEERVSQDKNVIYLDSPFAKRQVKGKKYSFTKFPNWSIVFLQELYFRGNPVIEFTQDVTGIAKGVNYEGDRSIDLYGEKKYEFDSKQLNKEDMKKMMGYILDHFQATELNTTKFNVPISTFNGIDIELLDVITVLDPNQTRINDKNKWLVTSITTKSKSNIVQIKLLNINATDTKPFKLDVKDVLEYKPVEIPTYDHNGNEGNGGGDNDGTGGEGTDKTIGTFHMSEVDPKLFRAKVEKFEGNYIYLKDFAGEEWETYVGKLFPESEFGISVDGETMLVHSDMNYRAYVRKRDIYNTGEQVLIAPESDVKFLIMSSFTDIDGTFYSRRCMIGDGDTYFSFHPITGAKFVGDFVIGENNKNSNNDLWLALQNSKTYREPVAPTLETHPNLKNGDMWIDSSEKGRNHPYVWNNGAWVDAQDKVYEIKGGNKVYYTGNMPSIDETNKDGDMWFDTSNNNKMYILLNGVWTLADDALDKVNTGRIVLNGNTTVNGDFRVNGRNINLTGDTTISGLLQVFGGGKGFILYNGTSEQSSSRRLVLTGDGIRFEEWV